MEFTIIIPILTIILPLIGGGIGYLIKQSIEKRKELTNEVFKERRELYQQFVNLIIDILKSTKKEKEIGDDLINKLYEFYKKYILYGSAGVINSYSDYFQYLYAINSGIQVASTKKHLEMLTKILFEMRKDLGLNNKGLGKEGINLLRAMFVDYDTILKEQKDRTATGSSNTYN